MSADEDHRKFEAGEGLQRLAHMAELMLPLLSADGSGLVLPPGRKLAKDETLSRPASARSFLYSDLLSSFSHVDALVAVFRGGTIYPHVPMTLLRPPIEAAGNALWLLKPTSRTERARRAVLRGLRSMIDFERQMRDVYGEPRQHEKLRAGLSAAAVRLNLDISSSRKLQTLLKQARTTDIFDAIADDDTDTRRTSLWRICSAWSHNDNTAIANFSRVLEEDPEPDGTMRVSIEAREDIVDLCAWGIGIDLSLVLSLARDAGITWPDKEDVVSEAIAIFPLAEVREQQERRIAQIKRRSRR